MTDRLEQIWAGFAQRSTLNLTGTKIDTTPRPSSTQMRNDDEPTAMLSGPMRAGASLEGVADPVATALNAMHAQMAAQAKSGRKQTNQKTSFAHQAAEGQASLQALPETHLEKTLFADMAFTRSKTSRDGGDYIQYAAGRQDAWGQRKKKRFFGLF